MLYEVITGRLTIAAQELAAFDLDTKQLVNANPARFRLNGSRSAPTAGAPDGYRGGAPGGPPSGGRNNFV